MTPAEEALLADEPRDENHEVIISKSKKVVALTKSVFVTLLIFLFFFSIGSTMLILRNQEKVADRLLECTVPTGQCYKDKVKDSQIKNAVSLLSVVEFCSNQHPDSVEDMQICINAEVSKL